MKKSFLALAAAIVAMVGFSACSNEKASESAETAANDSTQYDAELVDVDSTIIDTLSNGQVQVENEVTLTPENVN